MVFLVWGGGVKINCFFFEILGFFLFFFFCFFFHHHYLSLPFHSFFLAIERRDGSGDGIGFQGESTKKNRIIE